MVLNASVVPGNHRLITFFLHLYLLQDISLAPISGVREYCETEQMNATCDADEVIMMSEAHYGRMRLGRCVKLNYGHIGCSSDVLHLADTRCSGRHHCQIRIPDALFASTKPCPDDLKPYLETVYKCMKVQLPSTDMCKGRKHRTVTSQHGYLASIVTQESGCGGIAFPWYIVVHPGQIINVTLYDFNIVESTSSSSSMSDQGKHCRVYAVIREHGINRVRNITVCGPLVRQRNIYLSATNSIEVGLVVTEPADHMFVVEFEATGCPDLAEQPHGWTVRSKDNAIINCNHTKQSWHLRCIGTTWTGNPGNCSAVPLLTATNSPSQDHPLTYGSSILIIIAVALAIGLSVLVIGLCCLKKQRRRLCGLTEAESDEISEYGEEKSEKLYDAATHYQWTKATEPPSVNGKEYGQAKVDTTGDIYDFSHIHNTQPCTPLLKGRGNTIYGQAVRCTCPHVATPTYARRPANQGASSGGVAMLGEASMPASIAKASDAQYFVLDPDVISDNRNRPLQLRTFGPSPRQGHPEELYAMHTVRPARSPQQMEHNKGIAPVPPTAPISIPLANIIPTPSSAPVSSPSSIHPATSTASVPVSSTGVHPSDRRQAKESIDNRENERRNSGGSTNQL